MDYLLFLQDLRLAAPLWVNEGIRFFSELIGGAGGMVLMAFVYWCISKHAGSLLMMNFSLAYVCNGIVKNIFRVDRPFNRDPRLVPYTPATGYSFPSGHTMLATGFYGGVAVWQRRRTWLAVLCAVMALVTGFTRNWLGVHTLEDVVVGIVTACGVIALNCFLLDRIERHPEKDWVLFAAAMVLCIVYCLLFPTSVKPAGIYGGVMLGWFLERRYIRFEIPGSVLLRAVCFVLGILVVGLFYKLLLPRLLAPLGSNWAGGINNFISFLLITAGWPLAIKGITGRFSNTRH